MIALYDQAEDVVAEMIRQFNIGLTEDFLASAELRTLLMPAIRAEFRMGARYRFTPEPPWETAITCFTGLDPYVAREDALGWSEHAPSLSPASAGARTSWSSTIATSSSRRSTESSSHDSSEEIDVHQTDRHRGPEWRGPAFAAHGGLPLRHVEAGKMFKTFHTSGAGALMAL